MKDHFIAEYERDIEILSQYNAAKAAKDEAGMEAARSAHMEQEARIEAKGEAYSAMFERYKSARERGNEYIDICECWEYRNEADLIANFREFGIDTFTFSSSWSSAIESAWVFIQNGCTLMGMVEINSRIKNWEGDGYEKRHAYLFSVNR